MWATSASARASSLSFTHATKRETDDDTMGFIESVGVTPRSEPGWAKTAEAVPDEPDDAEPADERVGGWPAEAAEPSDGRRNNGPPDPSDPPTCTPSLALVGFSTFLDVGSETADPARALGGPGTGGGRDDDKTITIISPAEPHFSDAHRSGVGPLGLSF